MKIGFIGLGNMGAPMAANLARARHDVAGHDPVASLPDGVKAAGSAVAAARDAEIVITMLPDGDTVSQVVRQVAPAMQQGSCLIDCSTIDVASARQMHEHATDAGLIAIDAPVSGGVAGATEATLTFMAGGTDAAFAWVKPVLEAMGKRIIHCGPAGAGQAAKICNNTILGSIMIATCEGIVLADRLGLDRQKLFDVVSTSSGFSWAMNVYCPAPGIGPKSPADNGYKPGFSAGLMLKDLRLGQDAARMVDADTPMAAHATQLYARFVEQEGGGGQDFSAMLPRFAGRCRGQDDGDSEGC